MTGRVVGPAGRRTMSLGDYRLLAQVGAGPDGIAYTAEPAGGGEAVEVRVLGGARADAARWERLAKRLRLAALLDHPVAVRLRALRLEDAPPLRRAGAVRRPDPRRGPA